MSGTLVEQMEFSGPTVKVADLWESMQAAHPQQAFHLLLGDRVLNHADELLDPELFITAVFDTNYSQMKVERFEELDLKQDLVRGIYGYGFEKPAGAQQSALRPILDGRDVIIQASSGTGKTSAYLVGGLQRLDSAVASTQILVLAPTRELACPIQAAAASIGQYLRITSHACVARHTVRDDVRMLAGGPQLVVGTPGRINDMVNRRALNLDALKLFVLDETDEMMSRGFKGLIHDTLTALPADVQLAVFSATMPPDVLEEMEKFLQKPVRLVVSKKSELTLDGVRHFYVRLEEELKKTTLVGLIKKLPFKQLVVYCNTRRKVDFLTRVMGDHKINALTMDPGLDPQERDAIMSKFVPGSSGILISTDLVGADATHMFPLVINYDLPHNPESYLHRIGRHEHYYKKGLAINLVTQADFDIMKDIERNNCTHMEEMPLEIDEIEGIGEMI